MSTIRLQTNQNRLIANLRHAFTQASMLGELLQNARRAQARHIHITVEGDALTVSDDGTGIADLQTLIFIAESGWDEELIARENAFGLGVLSTLYFAHCLRVQSLDQAFRAETATIIRGEEIKVISAPPRVGTEIRLHGVQSPRQGISLQEWAKAELTRLCEAFPVAVTFNGTVIARPLADPAIEWKYTPIGRIRLDLSASPQQWRCFLQGLPIGDFPIAVVHQVVLLRDDMIARLPDRQRLLNEDADHRRIQAAIDEVFRQGLLEAKARLAACEFLVRYGDICLSSSNADLLNDVPFAPWGWFRDWKANPPGYRRWWAHQARKGIVARQALEAAGVWRIESDDEEGEDELAAQVYLEARKAFLLEKSQLHPGHWLLSLSKAIDPRRVMVRPGPQRHEDACPPLADLDLGLSLVDTLEVALDGEPGVFQVSAIRQAGILYLTPGADAVTRLVSDYIFDDRYSEDCEDHDAQVLRTFIAIGCAQDPAQVVSALLPDSMHYFAQPRLANAEVRLNFDAEGRLSSVLNA